MEKTNKTSTSSTSSNSRLGNDETIANDITTSMNAFRWLDTLEQDFDTSYVDIELLLGELEAISIAAGLDETIEKGSGVTELIDTIRNHLNTICSSWTQLAHKTLSTLQSTTKLEVRLHSMEEDNVDIQCKNEAINHQFQQLLSQLHLAQLQLHKAGSPTQSIKDDSPKHNRTSVIDSTEAEKMKKKFDNDIHEKMEEEMNSAIIQKKRLESQNEILKKKINWLQNSLNESRAELFGSRLATRYLDKELAGRIQQLQLLGRDLPKDEYERLWCQLEAEIHLHRHKAVVKACQGPKRLPTNDDHFENEVNEELEDDDHDKNMLLEGGDGRKADANESHNESQMKSTEQKQIGILRRVSLNKWKDEGLGMSITGGREHGVPILISELHEGGPAKRSNNLNVGDAILSVNDIDLRTARHKDAVEVLSSIIGQVDLEVTFVSPGIEENDDVEQTFRNKKNKLKLKKTSEEMTNENPSNDDNHQERDHLSIVNNNMMTSLKNDSHAPSPLPDDVPT
ncbi:hypothetical protein SNEBB_005083 [Seison nebaliae]|nr:hypothetical protein SNEBB_005083 [Seison nebaliae]